jgi:predicted phosphodiesterase
MRLLLISDNHGKLQTLNDLATQMNADAVIHAGDFGFFDEKSFERLSDRELRLHIVHSDLSKTEKERILALTRSDKMEAVRKHRLLGEFQSFLEGNESFLVPVYAVWGNHEDKDVVEKLFRGEAGVENLHILDHRQGYRIGPVFVYGLGGNFLPGSKMMQRPIAGGGGKIWSTLSQYADLVKIVENNAGSTEMRIFVSHVSPGKEPFVELVGARTRADFTISGHMGAPTCMVWNPFAVNTVEEADKRLQVRFDIVRNACTKNNETAAFGIAEAFNLICRVPDDKINLGRGVKAPRWYRRMMHINLPDAHVGYAVLDIDEADSRLQTFIR